MRIRVELTRDELLELVNEKMKSLGYDFDNIELDVEIIEDIRGTNPGGISGTVGGLGPSRGSGRPGGPGGPSRGLGGPGAGPPGVRPPRGPGGRY